MANKIPAVQPFLYNVDDIPAHCSRGVILSDVLSGVSSYETTKIFTDTSGVDPNEEIDYSPESDPRLDKFDAVELGFSVIEEELDKHKGAPSADSVEKK